MPTTQELLTKYREFKQKNAPTFSRINPETGLLLPTLPNITGAKKEQLLQTYQLWKPIKEAQTQIERHKQPEETWAEFLQRKPELAQAMAPIPTGKGKFVMPTIDEMAPPGEAITPPQITGDIYNPIVKSGARAFNNISATVGNLLNTLDRFVSIKGTTTEKVIQGGQVLMGVGRTIFTMVAAPFVVLLDAAEEIPGINIAAKPINKVFQKVGEGMGWTFKQALNAVPNSVLSKETKEMATPLAEEFGGLVGQILFAKGVHKMLTGKPMSKADRIVLKKAQLFPERMSTLDMARFDGIIARMKTQSFWKKGVIKGLKDEIVKKVQEKKAKPVMGPIIAPEAKIKPVEAVLPKKGVTPPKFEPIAPVEGKISGVARSIEAQAIEAGLTKGFKEFAEYTPQTFKEQAGLLDNLMKTDIERAKRMATGKEMVDPKIVSSFLLRTMEDYGIKQGDAKLLQELTNSPLASTVSAGGQTISFFRGLDPDSPVTAMKEIKNAREASVQRKTKGKAEEGIKTQMRQDLNKKISSKKNWVKLIDELIC